MSLFEIKKGNKVREIKVASQKYERNIQKLFEENLEETLNVIFLASEYKAGGGRIDTLGIDKNGAPVIIEYKLRQNKNVITQALSYLRWLLDHKADFEILCKDRKIDIDIDWESTSVICIAESFNKYDPGASATLSYRVKLLRYKIYENNILQIEIENYERKFEHEKQSQIVKNRKESEKEQIIKKHFSLEDYLKNKPENIRDIFYIVREKIISLDKNILEEAKSKYIAYKLTTNFVDIVVLSNSLKIFLNMKSGSLKDPWNIARDLKKPKLIGHQGNGDYEIKLSSKENIDKVFKLIKQSYEYSK